MTLEEAIKILEGKAEYWESKARKKNDGTMSTKLFCEEQAKVYRQGVDWLRELMAYREGRVTCEFCKHKYRYENERPCSLCKHNFMDKFEEEVNADDSIGTD